jgi:hypothetical protein
MQSEMHSNMHTPKTESVNKWEPHMVADRFEGKGNPFCSPGAWLTGRSCIFIRRTCRVEIVVDDAFFFSTTMDPRPFNKTSEVVLNAFGGLNFFLSPCHD